MTKTRRPPAPAAKRATLKTISELTGLSLSTVSLSLRGGASLKEETRRKVAEAAASVGYVPDRAGVRLRTGKTNVIALVLDGAEDSIDFARYLIQGIGHAIKGTRYHLTVIPEFERNYSVESVRYILENRTADGVIITHTGPRDPRVKLLMDNDFPFVSHGRTEFFTPHPYHDFHSELFAQMAVERLVEKGCRDLMLLIGDDRTNNYHNIVTAFERAAARLKVETRVLDHSTGITAKDTRSFARELASGANRPDGIICGGELRAISVISGLQEAGIVIGEDLHFISKQTSDILGTLFPHVDTIEEDVYAAGLELTRLLLRRIEGEDAAGLQTLAEPLAHWRE
ncbi:LacI family transcriptional regulator [Paradevosia shaoguanensis]|uniref:LacI family transcriptional regulator n=1 Tax=Paradevosia shaoguanensis TaxID=1335043 RepID=UPI003C7678E8